jgi:ABC-type sugar transport system permease subunit/ABC-type glycerol-3-phosphate transport system substrate-binding protein
MRILIVSCFLFILTTATTFGKEIVIRMTPGAIHGIPPKEAKDPRSIARRAVFESFRKANPDIRIEHSGGIELSSWADDSGFLMSMAGETAPDIFYVNFRQYYNYIDQGFCQPLDKLLAQDPEIKATIHPKITSVLKSYDGHIYGMPWYQCAQGLYYRKDHFAEAGLNPNRPPKTWQEFFEYGKKIAESNPERKPFCFHGFPSGKAWGWANFVWQAGGEIVAPDAKGVWSSQLNSPQVVTALDFYRKLTTETWVNPKNGKKVGPIASSNVDLAREIADGKVSMWFSYTNDVILATLTSDVNPAFVGIARMPAGPKGHANEVNAGMWAINSAVKDPKKIQACWRFIRYFMSDEAARINTEKFVELGFANLVNPTYLQKFGFADLSSNVDPEFVKASEDLFATGHPEPYGLNCKQVYFVLDRALEQATLEPNTPSKEILERASSEINKSLLGYIPEPEMKVKRVWALAILGFLACCLAAFGTIKYRTYAQARELHSQFDHLTAGSKKTRIYRTVALCVAPAVTSLLIWSYYPLLRGLVIGFQDYKLLKGSKWVGLDNFITAFTHPLFYKSIFNSFLFVGLSLLLGFFIPIAIALAINEIPKGKSLFRTIFYLPAMTSPIVVILLWRQFYDSSETGLLNTVLAPGVNFINWIAMSFLGYSEPLVEHSLNWLGTPILALFAVVLPGIWAAAGPGSILYSAALKNIPDERYEAADMDGANWKQKIRYITMPGLKPLLIVNLLGVFISGFKSMENIFLLTGGGPLYSTHTVGLEIWTNAFMFLKFGYATAAAWVMGSILIGFTVLQIRNMLNMRFTSAKL